MTVIERRLKYARAIWTAVVGDQVADDDLIALNGYMDGADAAIAIADDELQGAVSALTEAAASLNDAGRRFAQLEQRNMALLMTEAADRARAALGGQ